MKLYKYFSPLRARSFLDNLTIRFTPPISLNDPFEFRPYIVSSMDPLSGMDEIMLNDDAMGMMFSFLGAISDRVGVACFADDPVNPLMWSHYADSHSGAVVEFDADHSFFSSDQFGGRPQYLDHVNYSSVRPVINTDELVSGGFELPSTRWREWRDFMLRRRDVFLTKSDHWSYEREVRLVRALTDREIPFDELSIRQVNRRMRVHAVSPEILRKQIFEVPAAAITSVILGAKHQLANSDEGHFLGFGSDFGFEDEIRCRLGCRADLGHVNVLRVHADFSAYRLDLFDPEDFEEASRYLSPHEVRIYRNGFKGAGVAREATQVFAARRAEMEEHFRKKPRQY